ncbi:two-component system sensor histidine kinase BaeS [Yersinia ruckeri]|uniref:histidine kinase n=1 Tax=Yersinia ruckeri TaxID=29486 RepID=A0A0A8VLB4_YERRU|nr:two-component system sensor histidine kinase BaeS [Yersinia ruckeri]EKN3361698.1 two-component system sensor histidine kinase BaeS [Yersinia ruckeri]EKN4201222.1 two-component system sensor histidine kinase BaeS [Yersinia ruckeri]EKN4687947.1 two-component system sensor histidine kinase BaeS [Yersinia ruckeri]EKN4691955.1 two-component system sensor histidine kinase BaeS [Yersinia ruckeri]EKN4725854.1 two-component system sensor histidine kinase BaeS [Yersinia ruckeri]
MRIGITGKLFMAILATCMLVLITMHWGVRASFERGFIDYIKQTNEQRITMLGEALEEQYKHYGDWDFLRNNDRMVYQIMRSFEQNSDNSHNLPPRGWRTQFWVVDSHLNLLVGHTGLVPTEGTRLPIKVDNQIVGWVIATPPEKLTRNADINFDLQQRRTSWMIVALSTLLAAVVTWILSRSMLAPVKRLVEGTHRLAAGDFSARVAVSSRDELGRLAQDFNLLASALEKNEQMRRDFMADVSHELRTPLAVLRGELEALQDGVRQPTPESLSSLQAEVAMLTKLVNDLHQLSLSDRGALAYRKTRIDLVHLLQVALASFRGRTAQKQLTITTHLPEQATMFGDPDRLTQLIHNLMENSLRYTNDRGQLTISIHADENHLSLYWQDSEPGISDEQLQRIFERFYRTESSRNRASGGSGLGLAICHNIVEAHNGKIQAAHSPLGGILIKIDFQLSHSVET